MSVFEHCRAMTKSWKIFLGVLQTFGKVLEFFVGKRVGTLISTLLHIFPCNFWECLVVHVVVHLKIIFKSGHRFRCYGNVHVRTYILQVHLVPPKREMLASASSCSMTGCTLLMSCQWQVLVAACLQILVCYFAVL